MAFLEWAVKIWITQLWCSLQQFKMKFKNIHLPIAYSGINGREIFQNSDLVGMNREDSNLVSSKKQRVSHLEKWIARGYHPKLLKFSLFSSGNACASFRINFLANPYWHICLWPTIFSYLGKKWCVIFPRNPLNFIKNYPRNQWFCVECCSVKILLRVVSNVWGHQCICWWQSSKSEGCVSIKRRGASVGLLTNRGLVGQALTHFTSVFIPVVTTEDK